MDARGESDTHLKKIHQFSLANISNDVIEKATSLICSAVAGAAVQVVSRRTVKPPPRDRERIPLTTPPWPTRSPPTNPVAGRLATNQHRDDRGRVVCCSVSVDCAGQGVELLEAVAGGVAVSDVILPDSYVPRLVRSFFPLDKAVNYDGHERPLFAVQITELADGVFVGFVYNHALSDGTAFWDYIGTWAEISRATLGAPRALPPRAAPLFESWSPDGGADLGGLIARPTQPPPPQREWMLRFSEESLAVLKDRARQELLVAGDAAGAAAVTMLQALGSLLWRCFVRARRTAPDQEVMFRASANNRARLRPPLPAGYFGNAIGAVSRRPCAHAGVRARAAAWAVEPGLSAFRLFDPNGMFISSSPRFDMYGCDFGWGKPLAARSGKANKYDGKVSLFPGREGGGSIDAEVVLAPEHMAALELDDEFWAAVSPDVPPARKG
uniref:Acetyltransferase n=1 Tax=Setaria italica TaxID=4555 RepID=K4AL16_SETIT